VDGIVHHVLARRPEDLPTFPATRALHDNRTIVSRCVTENLLDRHMKPLFF
jgi:hypothetical protein